MTRCPWWAETCLWIHWIWYEDVLAHRPHAPSYCCTSSPMVNHRNTRCSFAALSERDCHHSRRRPLQRKSENYCASPRKRYKRAAHPKQYCERYCLVLIQHILQPIPTCMVYTPCNTPTVYSRARSTRSRLQVRGPQITRIVCSNVFARHRAVAVFP